MEGRTQKEAARQIGCPEGTIATHLARGRALLAKRMARHGLALSGGSVAVVLAQNASACVPASVISSAMDTVTLLAAGKGTMVSMKVIALTEGVLKAMFLTKLKTAMTVTLALILLGSLGTGLGLSVYQVGQTHLEAAPFQPDAKVPSEKNVQKEQARLNANAPKDNAAKKDLEALQGSWSVVVVEKNGAQVPEEILKEILDKPFVVIKGNKMTINPDDKPSDNNRTSTFTLDPSRKPKAMDNTPDQGPKKGTPLPAIYEIDGDTLKMCFDNEGVSDKRPTEFKTTPKSGLTLFVLKRVNVPLKKKDEAKPKKVETDKEKMQGTWKIFSADSNGKSVVDEGTEGDTTVITADTITMNCKSGGKLILDYRLDPSQKPKAIDVTPHKPDPAAGDVLKGIYDLNGEKLKICFSRNVTPGAARPSNFSADERGDRFYVLERIPAAKPKDEPKVDKGKKPLDPKLLAKLAVQLRSKDWDEKSAAVLALAKLLAATGDGKTDFSPVLEPLFENAGWGGIARDNARVAEDSLVRIGREATPLLRQRLKSTDAHDRRVAAELLVRIGPPDAALVALLRPLLTDRDDYVRKAAIDGLGIMGAPAKDTVGDLELVAANDSNLARRVAARIALMRIAGISDERVRALAAFLEMKDSLKDEVKGDKSQSGKEAAVYAASALGELGPKAKAAEAQLLAALKNPEIRSTVAHTLGQIRASSPEAVTALIDLLKNDPAREARRSAAGSLGAFGPAAKAAIPALREAMKGDPKGGWWVAADALAKIGGAEVVPVLIEALANPDADVRLTSMRGLGNLGVVARPARMALEKARQEDSREINRAAAAEALRKIEKAIATMK